MSNNEIVNEVVDTLRKNSECTLQVFLELRKYSEQLEEILNGVYEKLLPDPKNFIKGVHLITFSKFGNGPAPSEEVIKEAYTKIARILEERGVPPERSVHLRSIEEATGYPSGLYSEGATSPENYTPKTTGYSWEELIEIPEKPKGIAGKLIEGLTAEKTPEGVRENLLLYLGARRR
ncbi:MAG: hypothetical protein DRP08_06295 [Candidatus Aenigmatarchaeota archaeon]|nr:MAG: hypothetical protein DRP08_06295 [Candidatus Aenigmarchaeota archaeon]